MADTLIFWDRTRRETDQKCARARYWATEHAGRGIQLRLKSIPLMYGGAIHRINETALQAGPWEAVLLEEQVTFGDYLRERFHGEPDIEPRVREWQLMMSGHVYGWLLVVKPILERDYDLISVEESFGWLHAPGMQYATKPDVILRRKDDGSLWYMEWKTTAKADAKWLDSWNYDVQLQLGAAAYGAVTGEPVRGCIVQGLVKGYVDDDGHLISPFVYGWHLPPDPPLLPERWALKRPKQWKGWRRVDIDEVYHGGQRGWIEGWGEDLLQLFPQTPPILLNEEILAATLKQADWREREIDAARLILNNPGATAAARGAALDRFFPQTFKQCRPSWGEACDFLRCCWQPEVGADPVASGFYEPRIPHHTLDPLASEAE